MRRVIGMIVVCGLSGFGASAALAAPAPETEPCTAEIQDGVKYHWYTHSGNTTLKSGYMVFTKKRYGRWTKVIHFTDKTNVKRTFWGYHRKASLTIKSGALKQRWTGYKKYCKGSKIAGTVFNKQGKMLRSFTLDTSRTRK